MALNMIYRYDSKKTRGRVVPSGTQSGTPLIINTRPCVTLTARGDSTVVRTTPVIGDVTSITYANGGVGNSPTYATVAFDGTWEFPVTGALTSTVDDTAVYLNGTTLTLTSAGGTLYGYTDYPKGYSKTAGIAPVRIGA